MHQYFLGCDVSKGYADFILLDAHHRTAEAGFQLDDTFDGHAQLYQVLARFFAAHPDSTVYAAVESTGGYENNWLQCLLGFQVHFPLQVARLNPIGVHYHSKARLNRVVTDSVAARSIAEYLSTHSEQVVYQSEDRLTNLRRKWQFIQLLTKQKSALLTHLEKLLYIAHPELLPYCRDQVPQWVLLLVERWPTAASLAQTPVDAVATIPYLSHARAQQLVTTAQQSVASARDPLTADSLQTLAAQIRHLQQVLRVQTALLERETALPAVTLLTSCPGIGISSAIGLLLEMGPIERFPTVKQLCAYWGLHPAFKTSGDSTLAMGMSKAGRKAARAILFQVIKTAIVHNPLIRETYHRHLKQGKAKLDAMGICMHKMARIIYGMLKHQQPFQPDKDRHNQTRHLDGNTAPSADSKRRHQRPDINAPVSQRQFKKRKEQKMSHDDTMSSKARSTSCSVANMLEVIS